jgi:hypothetical protein
MNLCAYVFTLADNAEDAKWKVERWMEENEGNEFYDFADFEDPSTPLLIGDVPVHELKEAWERVEKQLPIIEGDIARYKASGDRLMEGYSHIRYGNILNENLCSDMPYFNMEDWDWSVPNKTIGREGSLWYAVEVVFHY